MFKYSVVFFCLFQCFFIKANSLISEKKLTELAQHKTWRKLLLLDQSDQISQSGIHSKSFFLTNMSEANALDELKKTIQAFSLPLNGKPDQHAQCKFKGRYIWLKSLLGNKLASFEVKECPAYNEWTNNNSTDSISVVFATGYLGNPASYYGHTLLKLNSSNINTSTKLEDVSLNFGAIVDENDGPIPYIIKGLFGGYEAGFSHIQYYFHTHNYGENELRDLWEYELDLTSEQLSLILGHAWEVLGQKYTYFFLDKNCVYRMAEILEVIEGINIIPNNPIGILPQSMIQKMNKTELNGKSLVKKISYHPSRQSRLYQRFSALSETLKNEVIKQVSNFASFKSETFIQLELGNKHKVIDTLLDYYQFLITTDDDNATKHHKNYKRALSERFMLPVGKSDITRTIPESPHLGRNPTLLQLGLIHNDLLGNGLQVRLRPAYYDALDYQEGHVPNSELSMADIKFTAFNSYSRLDEFNIVKIESVNGINTGLPGDKSKAWRLALGFKQASNSCIKSCLVPSLSASYGYTSKNYNGLVTGVFAGGTVQEGTLNKGSAIASFSLFIDYNHNEKLKMRLSAENQQYLLKKIPSESSVTLTAHYQINYKWGIRTYISKEDTDELGISLGYYF